MAKFNRRLIWSCILAKSVSMDSAYPNENEKKCEVVKKQNTELIKMATTVTSLNVTWNVITIIWKT